jgi:DNA-binding winged helix-turn-helix (wHTH) protein
MARFGSFELDPSRHRLLRDEREIHLTPKAFELLSTLIDAAPRVVTKIELHRRLWPDGIVSDATLVGLVKEIRRALGDRDRRNPLIRTVHRVGYAFEAPLVHGPQPSQFACWVVTGERHIALADGDNLIGRDPQSTVCLDYSTISRRHARIVISDTGALLEDLGSKNGTTLGRTRLIAPVPLCNGDCFCCGRVSLTYHESRPGLPTVTELSLIGAPLAGKQEPV